MQSRPTSTMSDSFFTHGLAGIDLHHADHQRTQASVTVTPSVSPVAQIRQVVASAFIAAGTLLAGDDLVRTPGTRLPA